MTIREIQIAVAAHCGVSVLDLISRRQGRATYRPRQVAFWLCRHLTPASFCEIGRAFGNRDHTTVMHGVEVIEHEIASGLCWATAAQWLMADLQGRAAA